MNTKKRTIKEPDTKVSKFARVIQFLIIIFTTAMTAATFWPLAFDFIDFVSGALGYDSKYASFHAIKIIYVVSVFTLGCAIIYLTRTFFFSLILELANKAVPHDQMNDKTYLDLSSFKKNVDYILIFAVVFVVAIYVLGQRLNAVKMQNDNEHYQHKIRILELEVKCIRESVKDKNALQSIGNC